MVAARRTSKPTRATPPIGPLSTLILVLAAIGAALCGTALYIHHGISTSQGAYTSFCDVSATVSCDAVLGSPWAMFLGIPVAGWALLTLLGVAAMGAALRGARGDTLLRLASTLLAVTIAMEIVSLYFLVISAVFIGVACPICLTIDLVHSGLLVVAVMIVLRLRIIAPPGWPGWLPIGGATAGALVAVGVLAAVQAPRGGDGAITVADVREQDPRFFAWYVSQPVVTAPEGGRHRFGPEAGPAGSGGPGGAGPELRVVEFSDFQCPHCARAFADLERALDAAGQDVQVTYRHFPLNSDCNPAMTSKVHDQACLAAVAAECAGAQGKYLEFHRLLFTHQDALDAPSLAGYAARLGLDRGEFERCLASPAAKANVAEDVASAGASGVKSTPTFFINGRRIEGSFQSPRQYLYAFAIERDLARAGRAAANNGQASPKPGVDPGALTPAPRP